MAKSKQQKESEIKELREVFSKQQAMYFVDYKGLKSHEITGFKKDLKSKKANLVVTKKTLAKILFKENGIDFDPKKLEGQVGIVFAFGEQFAPAKTVIELSRINKNVKMLGGCVAEDGKFNVLSAEQAIAYASIPSREELYAKLAYVLNDTAASFARVLNAVKEKMEASVSAPVSPVADSGETVSA